MTLGTILVIILILLLLGVIPNWGYSSGWGYGPSGIVGTILIVVLILLLLGKDLIAPSLLRQRAARRSRVADGLPVSEPARLCLNFARHFAGFTAGTFIPRAR